MKFKRMMDKTLLIYVIVGVVNFILCSSLMFLLYNRFHVSEHIAPIVNYGLGSTIWYFSCRFLIFRGQPTSAQHLLRFLIEVVVCYLVSYYVIAPLVSMLILQWEKVLAFFSFGGVHKIEGNCSMTVGMIAYSVLNYFGQRYFVFSQRFEYRRKKNKDEEEDVV